MSEIARREDKVAVAVGGPIASLDEAYRLSQALATANLMPNTLRGKPADVLAILLYGQDLGLSPMQAVQGIYVVNGRPSLSAQTWLALARQRGHRVTVREHTDDRCTVHFRRGDSGEEHTSTFTYEEAQRANLASKDVWKQYRRNMLLARAVANGMRFIAPEVALGFNTPDEAEEISERETVEATRVDVKQPTAEDGARSPEEDAAEVAAIEAEFVDEPPAPEATTPAADDEDGLFAGQFAAYAEEMGGGQ
jgi:hypothetical protein